jgi:HlyD family secretion protein
VSAPNRNLKLKPGMTASLTVEVARRDGVLRVPNAALRFRPSGDVLAALGAAPVPHGFSAADRESGTIWQRTEAGVQPVRIGTGVSDGTYTEVIGGTLGEGAQVVTRVTLAGSTAAQPGSARSPLLQTGPGPRR